MTYKMSSGFMFNNHMSFFFSIKVFTLNLSYSNYSLEIFIGISGIGLKINGISIKMLWSHCASKLAASNTINAASMVEQVIIVCLINF